MGQKLWNKGMHATVEKLLTNTALFSFWNRERTQVGKLVGKKLCKTDLVNLE